MYVKHLPNKMTRKLPTPKNLRAPWRWQRTEAETCWSKN